MDIYAAIILGMIVIGGILALRANINARNADYWRHHPRNLEEAIKNYGPERTFVCAVVGESFDNADGSSRQKIIAEIRAGDAVTLKHEASNPKDPHAVAVLTERGQIGYLGRGVAARMCEQLAAGEVRAARVERVGRGPSTPDAGVFLEITVAR